MPHDLSAAPVSATATLTAAPARGPGSGAPARERKSDCRHTCLATLDPGLNVVAADAALYRQFGRSPADVCGHSFFRLLHPRSATALAAHFQRLVEERHGRFMERMTGVREVNETFSGKLTAVAVQDSMNQLTSILALVQTDADGADTGIEAAGSRQPLLSELDARILEYVAAGTPTTGIAARMYLSRQGIEYHITTMLRRLKASNRVALVARAHAMGMLAAGQWPPRVLPEFVK